MCRNVDSSIINTIGLCSGIGMLEEAVRLGCEFFGLTARPAVLCEWEAYAAPCLLAGMEEQSLEPCPIWCGDLKDFDAAPFRGLVDILCAGLPCQPYSVAGKQRGLDDQRSYGDGDGPIPHFLRIVAECRPAVVFVENVPPWVTGGWFRPVGEELSRLGYTVESPLFVTAEEVGASHKRERVFVLAHALRSERQPRAGWQRVFDDGAELAIPAQRGQRELRQSPERDGLADGRDEAMADSSGKRRQQDPGSPLGNEETDGRAGRNGSEPHGDNEPECADAGLGHPVSPRTSPDAAGGGSRDSASEPSEPMGHAERDGGRQRQLGRRSRQRAAAGGAGESMADSAIHGRQQDAEVPQGRQSISGDRGGIFAPGPGSDWSSIPEAFWPAVERDFRFVVDGTTVVVGEARADALRCLGNSVVPLQAALAFVELMRRVI